MECQPPGAMNKTSRNEECDTRHQPGHSLGGGDVTTRRLLDTGRDTFAGRAATRRQFRTPTETRGFNTTKARAKRTNTWDTVPSYIIVSDLRSTDSTGDDHVELLGSNQKTPPWRRDKTRSLLAPTVRSSLADGMILRLSTAAVDGAATHGAKHHHSR